MIRPPWLAGFAVTALVIASCFVDRKSTDYACTTDANCTGFDPPRRCDTDLGYCVPGDNACPGQCNAGCDPGRKQCAISCDNATACSDDITCPDGWDCTITCANNGCDHIICNGAAKCTIACNGGNACSEIDCGDDNGRCDISCNGGNACDDIDCHDAACNVICGGTDACDTVRCFNSCDCNVACREGTDCDTLQCPGSACETAAGCVSSAPGCPTTCS